MATYGGQFTLTAQFKMMDIIFVEPEVTDQTV